MLWFSSFSLSGGDANVKREEQSLIKAVSTPISCLELSVPHWLLRKKAA